MARHVVARPHENGTHHTHSLNHRTRHIDDLHELYHQELGAPQARSYLITQLVIITPSGN